MKAEVLIRPRGIVLALLAMILAGPGCEGNADFSDAMPAPVTLSAEDYRSEIMAIDRLVFARGPVTRARRASLSRSLEELSRRVSKGSASKFLKIESLEIRRLAEASKGLPEEPPPPALQNNWMRIRSNLFEDRAWMARSARDL